MATVSHFKGKTRDSYMELVQAFPLSSIRSQAQLKQAQKIMDRLLAKGRLGDGEEIYLNALSDLVAVYEDRHYRIEPASDSQMLEHLMEAKGVTQIELHRRTDIPKSTISEILAGKKPFSRHLIRKLAEFFQVDVSVFSANF